MKHALRVSVLTILTMTCLFGVTAVRAEHRDTWIEIRAPHFTVLTNAGEHEGRRIARQFEEVRAMFEQSFPKLRVDFGKPTIVFALKNEDSLKLLMPSYGQNKNAMKIASFYRVTYDRNYAVIRTDVTGSGENQFHALYHEYAHGLFRLNYRGLPLWLDEGLAEYWGNSEIDSKEARVGMVDARQIRYLQQNRLLPITTLVTLDGSSPLYNTQDHAGLFYAESWLVVHYFQNADEQRNKGLLNKFLAALQTSDDPIEAAKQAFGDLKKLDENLDQYARRQMYIYQRVPLKLDISEKEFPSRTLSAAEGMIAQADYLLRSGHQGEALTLLHEAEGLDGKAAGVHDSLGYYHFLRADYENAGKEFDQALAANPNDELVYTYRALMLLRKKGYSPETTREIRANLEKTIALMPDFAPAHAFLCIAYSELPETKNKAAAEAKRAMDLEPGNLAYFIDLGKAFLGNGQKEDAKKVADGAMKVATFPRDRAMANAFLLQIQGKQNPSPQTASAAEANEPAGPSESGSARATATQPIKEAVRAHGQITELLCGHPPEVLLTLSSGSEAILLHVRDIGKVEIYDGGAASTPAATPCTKWRDRRASVTYERSADGAGQGEVKHIDLE